MVKKQYVDNEKFTQAVIDYNNECQELQKQGKPIKQMPCYIGYCLLLICENLAYSRKFAFNYQLDDMISNALLLTIRNIHKFKADKIKDSKTGKPNAFSYFTTMIYFDFLYTIEKDNRYLEIMEKYIENNTVLSMEEIYKQNKKKSPPPNNEV